MFTIYGFGYFRAGLRGSSFALSAARGPVFWYCCHGCSLPILLSLSSYEFF
ncbi:MAG: hypothetical protein WCX20_02265 [Candidatus Shapirobacteria bacterium]